MDEISFVEARVQRYIEKHYRHRRGFRRVGGWTLGGSLISIPSNRRRENIPDDPSHQLFILNSLVIFLALPVLWKGCFGGRSARNKNRKPHPLVLERYIMWTVRTRQSECEWGGSDKRFSSLADIFTNKPEESAQTAAKPTQNNIGESKTSRRGVSLIYLRRYFGRSDDGYRLFDVWATREYKNSRFGSSDYQCAEPNTSPHNKCYEQISYLLTRTDRFICFPLQSAPRCAVRCCGRGYNISKNGSIDRFRRALLNWWSIPLLKELSYNNWFVPQVHSAAIYVLSGKDCVSAVSIFGERHRLNARYWIILPPPIASLTDVGVGESEELLSAGIIREGFITYFKEVVSEYDFRITTTGHVVGSTAATNWRESSQSELYRIRFHLFNDFVKMLLRVGRSLFCCHPETKIRICRMEYNGFRGAVNPHPLNRWGTTGEINHHLLNDYRSRDDRYEYEYVDLRPDVAYEWSDRAVGPRISARYPMPTRNHSMVVYDRVGLTTGQDKICRWGYSMKYVKFYFICERLDLVIRGFDEGTDDPSPTNTIIFHPETTFSVSAGNHKPPQLPHDELEASSPKHDATVVGRCITDLPRRDEPAECAGKRARRNTTPAMPGPEYNRRFHPAKRRIETAGSLTRYRESKTTLRCSDRLRILGHKQRLSPRHCHLVGVIENNSIAYRQLRKIFSVRFPPPTFAAEHWRLILPDRDIISIIQSHISDDIMYPNHPQARDKLFALARHACELFHFSSAKTNSLLLRGKNTVGSTRQSPITKSFRIKRMGNIGVITSSCRPHACAEVLTPTKGSGGCPAESGDGKGVSSSGSLMKGDQSHTYKGIGIQTQPEYTLDCMRASSAGASSTDFASLIGRGLLAEESTALFDSFKDETSSKKYPKPRPGELVVDGTTNVCVADEDHNNAFGECNWFRADTPFLSTRKLWKYWGAIPETREKHASSKSNDRTKMNVRGFNIDQSSCRSTSQWLSRHNCNNEYPTTNLLSCALLVLVKGSSYIDLWRRLAVILLLLDAVSRKYRSDRWSSMLEGMIHNPIGGQNEGFFLYSPTNIKLYVQNIGYFIRTRERTNGRLHSSKSLDLYPRTVKVILFECMMTGEHIYRNDFSFTYNHHLFSNEAGHRIAQEQGVYYSRYLARSYDNGIANYHIRHSDSRNLIYLALWQRVTSLNHTYRIPPVQVRSGLSSPSRGILLIASAETGRSYLMNDLAAYFDAHLIPISLSDFYEYNRGFTVDDDIRMSGIKLLAASLCRLFFFLGLIEKKPPRVIWIRDMHDLDLGGRFARSGIGIKLASRALLILLAGFATCTQSMIVIGSTYLPGEIDPSLIRANRLERFTDVRALSIPRRKREFPAILRSKRFDLLLEDDTFSCISAFGYIIMCDYARDLASLAHEALLIGMSHSVFPGHAIGSVTLGQVVPDHDVYMDTGSYYSDKYVYRVGRAVAHSTVIGILPTSPSSYGSEMKDPSDIKIYSWSAWYLEPSIAESTTRELTRLLSRVSGSLAGSARRYSWPVADDDYQRRYYSTNSVRSSAEYDFTSARSAASEKIFAESPWLEETRKGESAGGEVGFGPRPQIRIPPGMAWNAIFAIPSPPVLDEEGFGMTNDTTAYLAPRPGLLPAISNISDWVQTAYARGKRTLSNHFMHYSVVHVLRHSLLCYAYKRIFFQLLSRMRKGAESQSESMPSTDRPVILGVYIPTGCIGYQQTNQSTLSIGKRFVWGGSLSIYYTFAAEFSHQPLMDQGELVSDQGGSTMPKGLIRAVRRHKKRACGEADQQFYAHDTDDVVPPVAVGQSTADDRSSDIGSESPDARRWPSIDMLTRINNIGFRSEHTHVFHPVYLYQAWAFFESSLDTFARFESNHEIRWLDSQPQDPPAHSILSESHRYSLKNTCVANTGCRCIKREGFVQQINEPAALSGAG